MPANNTPRRHTLQVLGAAAHAIWFFLFIASCLSVTASARSAPSEPRFAKVEIDNGQPRRDTSGEIVDAHDGCLKFFGGRYYLYGTAYGKSAGYSINNRFRVYSSPNLKDWRFDGELIESPPDGVYYRPYVIYNRSTRKYVLWYNWYPRLWEGKVRCRGERHTGGTFQGGQDGVKVEGYADRIGDGSLFADADGAGYFIYTTIGQNHSIRIQRLTNDFLGVTSNTSGVLGLAARRRLCCTLTIVIMPS